MVETCGCQIWQCSGQELLGFSFLCWPCCAVPCLALPCLALPCLALPCLALPCLALPCLALPCLALPSQLGGTSRRSAAGRTAQDKLHCPVPPVNTKNPTRQSLVREKHQASCVAAENLSNMQVCSVVGMSHPCAVVHRGPPLRRRVYRTSAGLDSSREKPWLPLSLVGRPFVRTASLRSTPMESADSEARARVVTASSQL